MVEVLEQNYFNLTNGSNKPVALYFTASWCKPCQWFGPRIEDMEKEYGEKIVFGKVDIEKETDIAFSNKVMSVPTLVVKVEGDEVGRTVGAVPLEKVRLLLESAL